jgi:hypothetical protein
VLPPGGCNNVAAEKGSPDLDPLYVGFAVKDQQGHLQSVSSNVPAYGTDKSGQPTFAAVQTAICALPSTNELSFFSADEDDPGSHCGDWINKRIADPSRNHYAPFTMALYFRPKPSCSVFGTCGGNSYYLDVRHTPGAPRVSLTRGLSPEEQGLKLIGSFLAALDEAKKRSDLEKQIALQNRFARYKPGSAASWAEQWQQAPQLSPAQYDAALMGSTAIFRGTVSRYSIDTKGFPQWITIYFRESPNGAFVVCSPYPDMFQEVVGMNLNALVGKTLEVVGPVEAAMCAAKGQNAGSVRVLESGMFHIK